jgi:hypothetical protein
MSDHFTLLNLITFIKLEQGAQIMNYSILIFPSIYTTLHCELYYVNTCFDTKCHLRTIILVT